MTPALFIITILAAADPLPWPPDLNDRLDRLVRENRAFWRVPGAVVAVTDGTNLRYSTAQGFADVAAGRRMDPNDVFPMASCTKAFTTLLAGCLVDEGKMAWDDPVVRHLPWFKTGGNASYRPITLRDAASHRSGYDAHDLLWYQRAESLRARVERLGGLAPEAAPGDRFRYQTSVFTTVGLAEEAVAGKTWEQLVGERILKPLELDSTWTDPARVPAKRIPQGYRLDGEARPVPANTYPWNGPDSTASIHANAADICRWLNFHMGDGSWAGKRIISQGNLQETHAPQITQELTPEVRVYHPFTKKMAYGLGWVIFDHRGDTVVAHAGAIDGHRVQVTMVPARKVAIVVLANLEMTRMNLATSLGIVDEVLSHPFRDYNRP
jgi:CubicO group peptidase (beta-lactamase class C family)